MIYFKFVEQARTKQRTRRGRHQTTRTRKQAKKKSSTPSLPSTPSVRNEENNDPIIFGAWTETNTSERQVEIARQTAQTFLLGGEVPKQENVMARTLNVIDMTALEQAVREAGEGDVIVRQRASPSYNDGGVANHWYIYRAAEVNQSVLVAFSKGEVCHVCKWRSIDREFSYNI
jgi:hypothetical protein